METIKKFDDDQEAVDSLRNMQHSLGNRARQIYNLGYKAGKKDGERTALEAILAYMHDKEGGNNEAD